MTLRFGLLAASRIAQGAMIDPVSDVDGVEIVAVAARDLSRAQEAATRWNVGQAYGSYQELLDAPDIDAVYIGTPAALHREWAVKAIEAGKHVLCEKPLAANAVDAQVIADAASAGSVVAMEAFHWRYHPFADQIRAVIDSGELGEIERIEARFDLPTGAIGRDDIRWDLALGGGALMDLGCYPVQWVRFAAGSDPKVVSAEVDCPVDGVDGRLAAELEWPSFGGSIHTTMIGDTTATDLVVTGSAAKLVADNPLAPQKGASLTVESSTGSRTETVPDSSTYRHQLEAFRDAVIDGKPFPTTIEDGVKNMAIIDACYEAAGLEPRPTRP